MSITSYLTLALWVGTALEPANLQRSAEPFKTFSYKERPKEEEERSIRVTVDTYAFRVSDLLEIY